MNSLTYCWYLRNIPSASVSPKPPQFILYRPWTLLREIPKDSVSRLCDPQLFGTLIIPNRLLSYDAGGEAHNLFFSGLCNGATTEVARSQVCKIPTQVLLKE